MHDLFIKAKQEHILAFLRAAGLYHLIILSTNSSKIFYFYLEFYLPGATNYITVSY